MPTYLIDLTAKHPVYDNPLNMVDPRCFVCGSRHLVVNYERLGPIPRDHPSRRYGYGSCVECGHRNWLNGTYR